MFTSQAIADLALMLSEVTTLEAADRALHNAVRRAGLLNEPTVDAAGLERLLVALAAEGGPIEQIAVQIALHGVDAVGGMDVARPGPTACRTPRRRSRPAVR